MKKQFKVIVIDPFRKVVTQECMSFHVSDFPNYKHLASFASSDSIFGNPEKQDDFFTITGFTNPSIFYGVTYIVGCNHDAAKDATVQADASLTVSSVLNLVTFPNAS